MTTTETKKANALEQLAADHIELIELCKSLTPEEWNAPSLCEGWRVRDVVAHIIGGQQDLMAYLTSAGGNKANQKMIEKRRNISTGELIHQLEAITDKPVWLVKLGTSIFIYDNWVHQQDIRWPLGKDRKQDPERLRIVLGTLSKRGAKNLTQRNQRMVATDMDWQLGEGSDEICGPAEALAMFLAGRRKAALERLSGPGVDKLK